MDAVVYVTFFFCMAGTNFDDWNPHLTHAAETFISKHPTECGQEPSMQLDGVSFQACQRGAGLAQWNKANDKQYVYIGHHCTQITQEDAKSAMQQKAQP